MPRDGQRAQEWHGGSDADQASAPALPATVATAYVHRLEEDLLGRGIIQFDPGALEWKDAERVPPVQPVERGGGPGAEAAVGVEEDDEP
jgi:hypothetical protein